VDAEQKKHLMHVPFPPFQVFVLNKPNLWNSTGKHLAISNNIKTNDVQLSICVSQSKSFEEPSKKKNYALGLQ
jgi:hypothetical protein